MSLTVKTSKGDLTISPERLIRQAERMRRWSAARRTQAVEAAKERLKGKHPRKRDVAVVLNGGMVGNG